ncbi:NADP-dependent oxidoreductase [Actinomadura rupiterrae]|uniref:NADP-dependent oxidoreductase n=1 Tax=Actinomadura rupiterrae TaxID=559627 RepID=UPI0020A5F632|nr:NADP-dependent oxidoreductase [Actinomadura rupiterrae]MCP2340385.1 NADPH:quinone reductase-like Zn-dependent oxidoreductase [Actinomadura rupiterrae]
MRAISVTEYGGPETLRVADVPEPVPGRGQVRIRIEAATVNPVDVAARAGYLAPLAPDLPLGLGLDAAGVIDAVGAGVDRLAVGDKVIGLRDWLPMPTGTHAEAIVLDADAVTHAPRTVDAAHAATLPLNGLTAFQALDLLDLPAGASLLVTGAAGAVGRFAVELAALRGLRIVAAASAADETDLRKAGAEFFIGRDEPLGATVRNLVPGGVDGVLDAAGLGIRALDALRNRGEFVAVNGGDVVPVNLRGTRVRNVWFRADAGQLAHLVSLVDAGRLSLRVADVLPLEDAAKAHTRLAEGGLRGRLVLTP